MHDEVQLIAYADRLGGDLAGLGRLLRGRLGGLFGGVHVLPFFTPYDGADAGFDPVDHTTVDPRLGTWDDIADLARDHAVTADLICNHVSSHSAEFRDVVARGEDSPHAGMFLTFGAVFPAGADEEALLAVYRPRPGLPFTPMTLGGRRRLVWTTFTREQIDLDVRHPEGLGYVRRVLKTLVSGGIDTVRLDAVGYAVKTAGTSCFMTPETCEFVDRLTDIAHGLGVEVLAELRCHYTHQLALAERVDRVYDFALPALVLHALTTGRVGPLSRWLALRPTNAVTVLDTHDGIGIVDVGPDPDGRAGLLTAEEVDDLIEGIHRRTGGESREATVAAASNADVYQVNSTYYSALGCDDRAYLAARAIQLFVPGRPQIYYVGLLAGRNDLDLLRATGTGREINRHRYTPDELDAAWRRPVVRALAGLVRFRNAHPAFAGTCTAGGGADGDRELTLVWRHGAETARLRVDVTTSGCRLEWTEHGTVRRTDDLLARPPRHGG